MARVFFHQRTALLACVVAQSLIIYHTWPLWQVRTAPPLLPIWNSLPQFSVGWLLILTLIIVPLFPRGASIAHALVLAGAYLLDQTRTQPQTTCIAVLLLAVGHSERLWLGRWYLCALWTWAGVHKLFSPDWFGEQSWKVAAQFRLDPPQFHEALGWSVIIYEIALGVLVALRPKWAAWLCIPLHVGVAILLSPWFADWNFTVIPWNLCLAVVGPWILFQSALRSIAAWRWQVAWIAFLMLMPIGFYRGWIDHYFAFVLYSDNLPQGVITSPDGCEVIETWHTVNAAFPAEHRLYRDYFDHVAQPGWKLHVAEPRVGMSDEYWMKSETGQLRRLTADEFYDRQVGCCEGIGFDLRRSVFSLSIGGARMLKRSWEGMIYAVEIERAEYKPELLDALRGLPNLEQLQLRGCNVRDEDLKRLPILPKLTALGIENTPLTNAAVEVLKKQPRLRVVLSGGTLIEEKVLVDAGWAEPKPNP